jgi:hypothetical protein
MAARKESSLSASAQLVASSSGMRRSGQRGAREVIAVVGHGWPREEKGGVVE